MVGQRVLNSAVRWPKCARRCLPSDYPELDFSMMDIYLIESGAELLGPMSVQSQTHSLKYLQELGVNVRLNTRVKDFDGRTVTMVDGSTLRTNNLIWAAGVKANPLAGSATNRTGTRGAHYGQSLQSGAGLYGCICHWRRSADDRRDKWPSGHPQVAQPAIQQGKRLAKNLLAWVRNEQPTEFTYRDLGTMATIGKGPGRSGFALF